MFDAVVLADSPHAGAKVLGLTLAERGRRVAARAGARRVRVIERAEERAELPAWYAEGDESALLILRAGDQVVHPPLVEPLLAAGGPDAPDAPVRVAVGPDGAYAGALWLGPVAARKTLVALADGATDAALAEQWPGAAKLPHGEIARHPATTPAEREGAARMLLRILVKAEDSPISKYVYRPISRPLTRLLVGTKVTPNQVSYVVGLLGLLGCWFTAQAGQASLILGAALVLVAGFIDGCDGEIARLRLSSSKFGAWLDTIVDELTTTVYFVALGWHTHLHRPDLPWIVPSIAVGLACYLVCVYGIYYFLIVVSKTGNSQHYVGDLEIIDGDGIGAASAATAALRPRRRAPAAPAWLQQVGGVLLLLVRRDFVNLAALAATLVDGYFALYLVMLGGGVLSVVTIVPEHLRLRRQLRELTRRGATPRLVSP
ncbi:MAG TPA: CDP-alcohol phosphatidyltransferase family protein [Kofleriaceae bacterium]|nr:CDP-alcohol phosphatidyltransferase family protein [Kofleriaceae bacterium]